MSYLDNSLVHAKELVRVLEAEIAKEHQLVEKQKVIDLVQSLLIKDTDWDEHQEGRNMAIEELLEKLKDL